MERFRICRDDVILDLPSLNIMKINSYDKVNERHNIFHKKISLNKGKTLSRSNSSVHYVINSDKLDPYLDKKTLFLKGSFSLNKNLMIKEEKPSHEEERNFTIRTFVKNKSTLNFSEFIRSLHKARIGNSLKMGKEISLSPSKIHNKINNKSSLNQNHSVGFNKTSLNQTHNVGFNRTNKSHFIMSKLNPKSLTFTKNFSCLMNNKSVNIKPLPFLKYKDKNMSNN